MKIQSLISLAMVASLMTACSDDVEQTFNFTEGVLNATMEGNSPNSRVSFDRSTGNFAWTEGDKIGVANNTSGSKAYFSCLNLISGAGNASGSFSGGTTDNTTIEGYAVYPYNDSHFIENKILNYYFPSEYKYEKVDKDYSTNSFNSFNTAMCGMINGNDVTMKHLGGVFCIKIEKMPVTEGKLQFIATDKAITGLFTANLDNEVPTLESSEVSDITNRNIVTINFKGAETDQPGIFYVPVPIGTYLARIKVSDATNDIINTVTPVSYTLERAHARELKVSNGNITAIIPTECGTLSEAQSALEEGKEAVSVKEIPTGNSEITIPAVTGEGTSRSLMLENVNVEKETTLTVNDASSATPENSVDNFTLSIPNNETGTNPLNVTITMPNTTVTLAGNGGAAKYGTVTAETADNTLILNSGVVVEKVVVEKGNVRVNKGATLSAIESKLSSVIIYKEEDATIPSNLDKKFIVVDADAADLQKVATEGGKYQLKNDIVLSSPLVVEKGMTLDLNGFALKANQSSFTDAEGLVDSHQCVVLVRRGGHLTVSGNGSIDYNQNNDVWSAIALTDQADEKDKTLKNLPAKLTVNGGHLKGFYYAICGQGTRHNTEITINGGIIEGLNTDDNLGIYHPQDGTMTITGGEIRGLSSAVELRSGTINVSGGKLVATQTTFKEEPNGSGTTMVGVALAVSQHSTNKDINVNISGGEFNGVKALYENDLQTAPSDNITIKVEKGTFNGGVYSKNCSAFVKGGTFSDPNVLQYLGKGANVQIAMTKDEDSKGFKTQEGQTVTIDMGKHTLTLTDPTVGSTGTETNSCQLLKGSTVTFKNGTLTSQNTNLVIQNYCTLTLENVTLNTPKASYSISNNNGICNFKNSTINAKAGGCAFDVYSFNEYEGVTVNVTNCTINGKVEFGGNNNKQNGTLIVTGGTMNGNLVVTKAYVKSDKSNISIANNVKFGEGVTGWSDYIK